jgi:hypothetical protein
MIRRSQANYADAKPRFVRALALRKQVFGEHRPLYALGLNNLAESLFEEGGLHARAIALRARPGKLRSTIEPSGDTLGGEEVVGYHAGLLSVMPHKTIASHITGPPSSSPATGSDCGASSGIARSRAPSPFEELEGEIAWTNGTSLAGRQKKDRLREPNSSRLPPTAAFG